MAVSASPLVVIPATSHDRQKFLGGSDIAAVLGISPWRTPLDLFRDKTTPRIEDDQRKRSLFRRGSALEPFIAELLVESLAAQGHSVEIVSANTRYQDPEHSMFAAEIDYELRLDGADDITNCELKSVSPFNVKGWGESGTDELPLHYMAQVMWGLGVTDRKQGILAALFGFDDFRTYPVPADVETIAAMRQRALAFWTDHVLTGTPPAPLNAADIARVFPSESKDGPPLLADESLTAKVLRLRACREEGSAREAEAEAIEFEIKLAMRDASELILPNGKSAVEWKTRSGTSLDSTRLKDAHPALHKEFLKPWTARVFRVKAFDTKGL